MTPEELEEEIVSMLIEVDLTGDEKRHAAVSAIRAMMNERGARRAAGLPRRGRGQNKEYDPKSFDLTSDVMQSVIDLILEGMTFGDEEVARHKKITIDLIQDAHGNALDERTARKILDEAIRYVLQTIREAGDSFYGPDFNVDDADDFEPIEDPRLDE